MNIVGYTRKRHLITGVWLYGGNEHIAYRHIAKHQNVLRNNPKTSTLVLL